MTRTTKKPSSLPRPLVPGAAPPLGMRRTKHHSPFLHARLPHFKSLANDLKWGSRAWRNGEWCFVRRIPRGGAAPGTRGRGKEDGFFVVRVIGRYSRDSSHGT